MKILNMKDMLFQAPDGSWWRFRWTEDGVYVAEKVEEKKPEPVQEIVVVEVNGTNYRMTQDDAKIVEDFKKMGSYFNFMLQAMAHCEEAPVNHEMGAKARKLKEVIKRSPVCT